MRTAIMLETLQDFPFAFRSTSLHSLPFQLNPAHPSSRARCTTASVMRSESLTFFYCLTQVYLGEGVGGTH